MTCNEFLKVWSRQHDGCDASELSAAAQAHLISCAKCQHEVALLDGVDQVLSRVLPVYAEVQHPRASAVTAAIAESVAAVESLPMAHAPTTPRLRLIERQEPLRFVPQPLGVARWAIAAALIMAATWLSRGQPFSATPTYADATATAAAAMPSVTPSATFSAQAPGTPAVVSLARPAATPTP